MNSNLKIMVVDDDEQIRIALQTILKKEGYEVNVFPDALSAYIDLQKEDYSLIISDQKMPEMTGLEFLKKVNEEYEDIPFIMITAYGTILDALGMVAPKPYKHHVNLSYQGKKLPFYMFYWR